jgi:hypothetical protein
LTLQECLFLATIIPKPRKFMWQFDTEGRLKSFASQQQKFLGNLMLRRGILTPEDTIGQSIPLQLTGSAHSLLKLKVQDSIALDSLDVEEPFGF